MSAMDDLTQAKARVIARAWTDPAYRDRLASSPRAALAEEGIAVPGSVTPQVHFADASSLHIVVPPAPGSVNPSASGGVHCVDCQSTNDAAAGGVHCVDCEVHCVDCEHTGGA